jgi:hypothetical protein
MNVKLCCAALLLVLLAPADLGAAPVPEASCSSAATLTEILTPAVQTPATPIAGLSPLDGALDTACSGYTCDECAPCGGRVISCTNGEPVCVCWNC